MEQQGIAVPGTRWGDLLSGRNAVRSLALAGGVALHAVNVYIATTMLRMEHHALRGRVHPGVGTVDQAA